jgi:two-component system KDP operon response regulator KdpE
VLVDRPDPGAAGGRILLVEDEHGPRTALAAALGTRGYAVATAESARQAIDIAGHTRVDLMLVDLGLPDLDGIELCRRLGQLQICPIIVVTADTATERTVAALELGADDYVTKPFGLHELLARIRRSLRPPRTFGEQSTADDISIGDLSIDLGTRSVRIAGGDVELASRLVDVLIALARNEGRLLTYRTLRRLAWGDQSAASEGDLRDAVAQVRRLLASTPSCPQVQSDSGIGYRLVQRLEAGG